MAIQHSAAWDESVELVVKHCQEFLLFSLRSQITIHHSEKKLSAGTWQDQKNLKKFLVEEEAWPWRRGGFGHNSHGVLGLSASIAGIWSGDHLRFQCPTQWRICGSSKGCLKNAHTYPVSHSQNDLYTMSPCGWLIPYVRWQCVVPGPPQVQPYNSSRISECKHKCEERQPSYLDQVHSRKVICNWFIMMPTPVALQCHMRLQPACWFPTCLHDRRGWGWNLKPTSGTNSSVPPTKKLERLEPQWPTGEPRGLVDMDGSTLAFWIHWPGKITSEV